MSLLPSDLDRMLTVAEQRAKEALADVATSQGAAEISAAIQEFGRRSRALVEAYGTGRMTAQAAGRAAESEAEALAFTLAAIVHENKRAWFAQLFTSALKFAASLLTGPK